MGVMNPEQKQPNRLKQLGRGAIVLIIAVLVFFFGQDDLFNPSTPGAEDSKEMVSNVTEEEQRQLDRAYDSVQEDQPYSDEFEVAAYMHKYDELPPNYITKNEAKSEGWVPEEGNLWDVTDQKSIGGDHFGNFEGNLPPDDYREADVNYNGGERNAERLVYSKDGDIFYTENHYRTFTHFY